MMVPLVPPGADIGNQRTADVVPDAENRARQRRFRAEILGAQCRAEATVLHTDFEHHRSALGAVQTDEPGSTEPHRVAEQIMQDDDAENDETACGDCCLTERDDDGNDQDDAADGDERQASRKSCRWRSKRRFTTTPVTMGSSTVSRIDTIILPASILTLVCA